MFPLWMVLQLGQRETQPTGPLWAILKTEGLEWVRTTSAMMQRRYPDKATFCPGCHLRKHHTCRCQESNSINYIGGKDPVQDLINQDLHEVRPLPHYPQWQLHKPLKIKRGLNFKISTQEKGKDRTGGNTMNVI